MTALAAFVGVLVMVFVEGLVAASMVIPGIRTRERVLLRVALSLPLAAIINVLLFFLFTVVSIPLTAHSLLIGHAVLIAALFLLRRWLRAPPLAEESTTSGGRLPAFVVILCLFILGSALLYSFAHSFLLPPFQYDSFTNWLMRSKISFLEHRLIFDNAGVHAAIRKPFYPFLVHALHIISNVGQGTWQDNLAAGMTFLLSVSLLASTFLLLKRAVGGSFALLAVTIVLGIPLFGVHLGEGYADHLLAEFGMASLAAFALAQREHSPRMLLLSGLLASAAVWTKAEGVFFVFLPWLLLTLLSMRPLKIRPLLAPLAVAALWPLFLLLRGYAFTPHGSADLAVQYHPATLRAIFSVLAVGGSFELFWPLLALAVAILFVCAWQRKSVPRSLFLLLPGFLCLLLVLGIYAFTSNASYLLSGESFDRQLLTPAALFVVATAVCFAEFMGKDVPVQWKAVPR